VAAHLAREAEVIPGVRRCRHGILHRRRTAEAGAEGRGRARAREGGRAAVRGPVAGARDGPVHVVAARPRKPQLVARGYGHRFRGTAEESNPIHIESLGVCAWCGCCALCAFCATLEVQVLR